MSNSYFTLADLVKLNNANDADSGISDILNDAPLLRSLYAVTATNGTNHSYLKQTTAPTVYFRALNTGKPVSASGYSEVVQVLKLLDATTTIDIAQAGIYRDGAPAFVTRENKSALTAEFFKAEQQMIYGTGATAQGGDAAGFSGLVDSYNALANSMVVNGGGSTANGETSVWAIRSTEDEKGVAAVIGNGGNIEVKDTVIAPKVDDSDSTKAFMAYWTPIMGYLGIQIGGAYSVARLCNLDATHGLTDAKMFSLAAKFPSGKAPTHFAMNRQSYYQLLGTRTAVTTTGDPVPFATNWNGIPIVITEAIVNTEAVVS